jgi:hypothetical protein
MRLTAVFDSAVEYLIIVFAFCMDSSFSTKSPFGIEE